MVPWRIQKCRCFAELIVILRLSFESASSQDIGFCMDVVPTDLEGTGFAALSTTTQGACASGSWCPLRADTKVWTSPPTSTASITFYEFSPCCSGRQGTKLLYESATGLPTCESGRAASTCTRTEWHNKFMKDFIQYDTSGYDFRVTPSTLKPNAFVYGGTNATRGCACSPDHAGCVRTNAAGTVCMICDTDESCSDDVVQFNLNFFKIHSVDLKTSELSFAVWVREIWYDHRLDYDYQCYGGLDYFEVFASAGDLENTQIWVPDVALYNAEQDIWQGSIAPRQASVWSCWDGLPSRGGCGYVYWARPGILKALCKYGGLVRFPYDELSCELEFGPWGIDGRFQDLIPRPKDNGIEYACDGCEAVTGLTAGSKFQDYVIQTITIQRLVVRYPSSPTALWPELVYEVKFSRSQSFYEIQLVMPGCLLTILSFIVFWMNPTVTDRLGFGCTVMLALMTNQIVSTEYMPVCEERVLMDYMGLSFFVFSAISLIETGFVLYLNALQVDTWAEALIPYVIRKWRMLGEQQTQSKAKNKSKHKPDFTDKDYQLRRQLYHQIFYAMDRDFSGSLELDEIDEFGYFILGSKWSIKQSKEFLKENDDSFDGSLNFEEFAYFCEEKLLLDYRHVKDLGTLKAMIKGFLVVLAKKHESTCLMWKLRALQLDQFCRWAIPPGFAFFLLLTWLLSEADLEEISLKKASHVALILSGLYPIMFIFLTYGIFVCIRSSIHKSPSKALKLLRTKGSSEAERPDPEKIAARPSLEDQMIYLGKNAEVFGKTGDEAPENDSGFGFANETVDIYGRGGAQQMSPILRPKAASKQRFKKPNGDYPREDSSREDNLVLGVPRSEPKSRPQRPLAANAGNPLLVPLASMQSQPQPPRRHAAF